MSPPIRVNWPRRYRSAEARIAKLESNMTSKRSIETAPRALEDAAAANAADAYVFAEKAERHARETFQRSRAALVHWLGGETSRTLPDGRRVHVIGWRGETPVRIAINDLPLLSNER